MEEQGTQVLESPQVLSERLGLQFSDYLLLCRALTHRSYLNEHPEAIEDNERLEFLGDAVLDFLVGAWLYNRFPEMAEGQLTRLRSALVRTEQLASFSIQIGLGAPMRLGRGEA
jgi:ribonuclease-3